MKLPTPHPLPHAEGVPSVQSAEGQRTYFQLPISNYATVGNLNLHYLDWGGNGTPIVCLHGLASTAHMFDLVAPQLTALGRVIALDQRGHGESDKPDSGYDFDAITQDVASFVQAIGIAKPFVLVGHSWGGSVALYFATKHPQMVRGAALLDGGFGDMRSRFRTWDEAEHALTPPPLVHLSWDDIRRAVKERWLTAAWSPDVERAALNVFEADAQGFVQRRLSLANHMRIARALWEFTPAQYFARVQCPVLLVVPMPADAASNGIWAAKRANVETAQKAIRDCQVAYFEDTIHDVPWHRPMELAKAITSFIAWLNSGG